MKQTTKQSIVQKLHYLPFAILCMLFVFLTSGCAQPQEYKNIDDTFSISLTGNWEDTSDEAAPQVLSLDMEDDTGILTLGGFPKATVGYASLDAFIDANLASFTEAAQSQPSTVTVEFEVPAGMTASEGYLYTYTPDTFLDSDPAPQKMLAVFLESETSYYVVGLDSTEQRYDKNQTVFLKALSTLTENTENIEIAESSPELTDTILWFNGTYAVLTERNKEDIFTVGGRPVSDSAKTALQQSLLNDWEITDKTSADAMLQWLVEEGGHNQSLLELYASNGMDDFASQEELNTALAYAHVTYNDRAPYLAAYNAKRQFGDAAIAAWDYDRAMSLCGYCYLAGYYTYEEAMDKSLEIAKKLQSTYTSWDAMVQSYLYGLQYWGGEMPVSTESPTYLDNPNPIPTKTPENDVFTLCAEPWAANSEIGLRILAYDDIKKKEGNPYQLDWNMELQKTW